MTRAPASSAAANAPINRPWRIEPLAGWHLPLLDDPAFLPLQPQLQRAALLGLPDRLLQWLGARPSLAPQVLVAFAEHSQTALGLVVCRRLNRSGSCWQVQHLRTIRPEQRVPLGADLLREALQRTPTTSWVAAAACSDRDRLGLLRHQGFQPLRHDRLWCWQAPASGVAAAAAPTADGVARELQLRPLNRRNAQLLWHLEQAACPAQLRQILDRRVEDLLDQSQVQGWLLLDPSRGEAVAAARWAGEHAGGGHDLELTVHPGWDSLYGPPTNLLLQHLAQTLGEVPRLWLRSDPGDKPRLAWLAAIGAQERAERVLMARSLWRRQALTGLQGQANRRLEAVLAQLQPRRRPLPTPLARR
jgi:hypothetical protein